MRRRKSKIGIGITGILTLWCVCLFCGKMTRAAEKNVGAITSQSEVYDFCLRADNSVEISAEYYSSPDSRISYHTEWLCFSKEPTGKNPGAASVRKLFYVGGSQNHDIFVNGDVSYDTFRIPGGELVETVRGWYPNEDAVSLLCEQGITVYLSDLFVLKNREKGGSWVIDHNGILYDSLEKIQSAAAWSNATKQGFAQYYDVPVTIRFQKAEYEVRRMLVDASGKVAENRILQSGEGILADYAKPVLSLANTVSFQGKRYTDTMERCITTDSEIPELSLFSKQKSVNSLLLEKPKTVVWILYRQEETNLSPTPSVTETPTKVPTKTPTKIPTPTPEPVPASGEQRLGWEYYFTTEEGYTVESIKDKKYGYKLAVSAGGYDLQTSAMTTNKNRYCEGTDEYGNRWFFLTENGNEAWYVHPSVYEGADATMPEGISKIQSLTFPAKLLWQGNWYTVKGIGGFGANYHAPVSSFSGGVSAYLQSEYHTIYGEYANCSYTGTQTYSRTREQTASYQYGILGNGKILSYSLDVTSGENVYSEGVSLLNYYVYNTTLKQIVIPDSVVCIQQGAFYGCQALDEITGGNGIQTVETEGFCGGIRTQACKSRNVSEGTGFRREYYYFNEAYSMTDVFSETMKKWEKEAQLSPALSFPSDAIWPNLKNLGRYSFAYHSNLNDVVIGSSVEDIGRFAFAYDELPVIWIQTPTVRIETPSSSQTNSGHLTLSRSIRFDGTYYKRLAAQNARKRKEYEELSAKAYEEGDHRTVVYADIDSTAADYVAQWEDYYVMYSGEEDDNEGDTGEMQDDPSSLTLFAGAEESLVEITSDEYDITAVPSTKTVDISAITGEWMFLGDFERKTQTIPVKIEARIPVCIQKTVRGRKTEEIREIIISLEAEQEYSYWVYVGGGIFYPTAVKVKNDALLYGYTILPVQTSVDTCPNPVIRSYDDKERIQMANNVTVTTKQLTVSADIFESMTDEEKTEFLADFVRKENENRLPRGKVRSDYVAVGDCVLLSDEYSNQGKKPDIAMAEKLAKEIPVSGKGKISKKENALRKNAENRIYESQAYLCYSAVDGQKGIMELESEIPKVNEIGVFTPVYAELRVKPLQRAACQTDEVPENATVLSLSSDRKTGMFAVEIVNSGFHSERKGFGNGDYSDFLASEGTKKKNEVSFSFPVWIDVGNDNRSENDVLLPVGEWYCIGEGLQQFYPASFVKSGCYTIKSQSVPVNGKNQEKRGEYRRNTHKENVTAWDESTVFLTGKLYDFRLWDVAGNGIWSNVEKIFTVGRSLQNSSPEDGIWDTLPLRSGVHPIYPKLGYLMPGDGFTFSVKSLGFSDKNVSVLAIPHLVYVKNGKETQADFYYETVENNTKNYVKWTPSERAVDLVCKAQSAFGEWEGSFTLPNELFVVKSGSITSEGATIEDFSGKIQETDGILLICFEVVLTDESGRRFYYGRIPKTVLDNTWKEEAGKSVREDAEKQQIPIKGGEVAVTGYGPEAGRNVAIHGIY